MPRKAAETGIAEHPVLFQGVVGSRAIYYAGCALCFIPPFVFGPLLLVAARLLQGRSHIVVTAQQLRYRVARWPRKPREILLDLSAIRFAREVPTNLVDEIQSGDVTERLLTNVADLEIVYETEAGLTTAFLPEVRKPRKLLRVLEEHCEQIEAVDKRPESRPAYRIDDRRAPDTWPASGIAAAHLAPLRSRRVASPRRQADTVRTGRGAYACRHACRG